MGRTRQAGFILIAGCLGALLLVGLLGLAIDTGYLEYSKQRLQVAADAAALAAALELDRQSGEHLQAAREDAALNGFADGVNGVEVKLQTPPLHGRYEGREGASEVIVSQAIRPLILSAFGCGQLTLQARAVAYPTVEGAALAE